MLYLIERALVLVFFCHPPILFFLNGIRAKRFHVAWVALFSFLLGWFLCLPLGIVLTAGEIDRAPVTGIIGLVLLFTVMGGWLISAAVILFWAPIITIFVAKSRKIKVAMGALILAVIVLVSSVYIHERNFWRVPGNRLIHEEYDRAFLDGHFLRVFQTENDLLKNKLIREWELKAYMLGANPRSFAVVSPDTPEWWPSEDVLDDLERYGWEDESKRRYCSLWYDPNAKRLYVESGDW